MLLGFIGPYPGRAASDPAVFDIGTSSNVETGFDSVTVLRWGRWSGGTANITLMDGTDCEPGPAARRAFTGSADQESAAAPVMPITQALGELHADRQYVTDGQSRQCRTVGQRDIFSGLHQPDRRIARWSGRHRRRDLDRHRQRNDRRDGASARESVQRQLSKRYRNGGATGGSIIGNGVFSGFFSASRTRRQTRAFPGSAGLTYSLVRTQAKCTTVCLRRAGVRQSSIAGVESH